MYAVNLSIPGVSDYVLMYRITVLCTVHIVLFSQYYMCVISTLNMHKTWECVISTKKKEYSNYRVESSNYSCK